jgi:hypothetical protein
MWFRSFCLLFVCGALSCRRDATESQSQLLPAAPRPLAQTSSLEYQEQLAWNRTTLAQAYEAIGHQDPRWDATVRGALEIFAQARWYHPPPGYPDNLAIKVAAAVNEGCDDPLVAYFHARFVLSNEAGAKPAVTAALVSSAAKLEKSSYPAIRKFYACLRAGESVLNSSPDYRHPTPEASRWLKSAGWYLVEVVQDQKTPLEEVYEAGHDFFEVTRWIAEGEIFEVVAAPLFQNWPNDGRTYLIKGEYLVQHAWRARGGGFIDSVSKQDRAGRVSNGSSRSSVKKLEFPPRRR